MEQIIGLTRQDIYNIIIPIAITVIGWLLTLLKDKDEHFTKRWIYTGEKSDCNIYERYFFVIMGYSLIFNILAIVIAVSMKYVVLKPLGIEIDIEVLKIMVSVLSVIFIVYFMFIIKPNNRNFKLVRAEKYKNSIIRFFRYAPFICAIWIWGFPIHIKSAILDTVFMLIIVLCECLSAILMDQNKKIKYPFAELCFQDGTKGIYLTEDIKQKGNWIIVKDMKDTCEIRYRREDLVRVKYFNTKNEEK